MDTNFIIVNFCLRVPIYKQIYASVKNAILEGILVHGEKLPSIRQMSQSLNLSKTSIEKAYSKLNMYGYVINKPKSGYYVSRSTIKTIDYEDKKIKREFRFDFSGGILESDLADCKNWIKYYKNILDNEKNLTVYGDPQGEYSLRKALVRFVYSTRGVQTNPENIFIGAGLQQSLITLMTLLTKESNFYMNRPFFKYVEQIAQDLSFSVKETTGLPPTGKNYYFISQAAYRNESLQNSVKRREDLKAWLAFAGNYIIEDDYNEELKYVTRPMPAFHSLNPNQCVYIGSFSKTLLPSVRLSYMILPKIFADKLKEKIENYNCSADKLVQLTLTDYLNGGFMEKHLKKMKNIYSEKYGLLIKVIHRYFKREEIEFYEGRQTIFFNVPDYEKRKKLSSLFYKNEILAICRKEGFGLNFSGINLKEFPSAVELLDQIFIEASDKEELPPII